MRSIADHVNNLVQAKVPADPVAYERATDAVKVAVPVIELALGALEKSSERGGDITQDLQRRLEESVKQPEERILSRLDTAVVVLDALHDLMNLEPTNGEAVFCVGGMLVDGSSRWRFRANELPAMKDAVTPFSSLILFARSLVRNIWDPAMCDDLNLEKVSPREATISARWRAIWDVLDAFSPDGGGSEVGGQVEIKINGVEVCAQDVSPNSCARGHAPKLGE